MIVRNFRSSLERHLEVRHFRLVEASDVVVNGQHDMNVEVITLAVRDDLRSESYKEPRTRGYPRR